MILVTGATGFLGRRVCRLLEAQGKAFTKTSLSMGVDLTKEDQARKLFSEVKPEYVLNCASFVGGIMYGYKHPISLFHKNLKMTLNLLEQCEEQKVKRIVNPISNCTYPAKATLYKENEFWDGPMHESVLVYGFVRKAVCIGSWAHNRQSGLDSINIILSNMYGPEDHFEEERSHAMGALIMKFVKAKKENLPSVSVWGTGTPVREWIHIDDGAEAMVRSLDITPHVDPINIGIASGVSVKDLALMIKKAVGYEGQIEFDTTKPDGAAYKTVDGSRGEKIFGWKPKKDLVEGINETVQWYINHVR